MDTEEHTESQADRLSGAGEDASEENNDTPVRTGDDGTGDDGDAGPSDQDEKDHNSEDGSSDHTSSSSLCNEDTQEDSFAEEEGNTEELECSDIDQEADCPPSKAISQDGYPGSVCCPHWCCCTE